MICSSHRASQTSKQGTKARTLDAPAGRCLPLTEEKAGLGKNLSVNTLRQVTSWHDIKPQDKTMIPVLSAPNLDRHPSLKHRAAAASI